MTLGKDLGRDLGRNHTTKTYNYRLFILLWSISRVFTKVSAEVPAGEYTISIFSLHLSSIKINKQLILHRITLDSRERPWKRPWKRPWQELYKQNIQLSIVHSFMVYLESIYQGLSRGLSGGLYNDYV